MTAEELKQIYYLNKEIAMWQKELEKLECQSIVKGQQITGMPFVPGTSDKTGELATERADTELIIRGKYAEVQRQRKRIMEFIDSVEDSLMRQIIYYRCISCFSWNQVAAHIGGGNTAESLRQQYNRHMKTCHTCHK